MNGPRRFGILLHPTSLPGNYGIGEIGREALEFVDLIREMGAEAWQMLPLNPGSLGNSPYSADSAFAGNPLLISIEKLLEQKLLPRTPRDETNHIRGKVSFDMVRLFKNSLFKQAFDQFLEVRGDQSLDFSRFVSEHAFWLNDYALFRVLKNQFNQKPWYEWPEIYKNRDPDSLTELLKNNGYDLQFHRFLQYLFFSQWDEVHRYASANGISLIGDLPIFVAMDSADVWSQPELYDLDENRNPKSVAGVPPDYFSPTGQKWGNPHYNWTAMKNTGYRWWINRFRVALSLVDMVRIDHFRGFEQYWSIPAHAKTAETGEWLPGPGKAVFEALINSLGLLPVIAEDLGIITPEVENLRRSLGFPGMKILQFAFGGDAQNPYLPFNHSLENVVYTGTHDNNTTLGWWNSLAPEEREKIAKQLESVQGHAVQDISADLLRMAMGSVCRLAVIPVQDILDLDSLARMNIPGTAEGNWDWRLESFDSLRQKTSYVRHLARTFNRLPGQS